MATTIAPVASAVLNLAAPLAKAVTDNGKLARYARGVVRPQPHHDALACAHFKDFDTTRQVAAAGPCRPGGSP